ncbi:precorrin-2 dehydrogenase/sirohydrochlorin ferrochelatase family protein [Sphingomonas dokdonensis]|uniref:precorrin-2 dehydrogenase/sirohydrochlorin ferrochelatase family protein n=1 Tax=Sphingomonas dokdonensis TaxID=344880 RepID=UPI000B4B4C3D|nr:NAD(P)-dependent oxidoreductase [Sphingomonas dokdonensis]
MHSLPIFVRLQGRHVILVGVGEAADAKRRLLERAGAIVVGENIGESAARLAIVVDDDAAVARLKARGVLVNAVDRPELCDFTLPAIVDRAPVLVAIGTGGASAGLAAALRQRLEALLPASLGRLADALFAARPAWRARYPEAGARRRAIAAALAPGGTYDPLQPASLLGTPPEQDGVAESNVVSMTLHSRDPDDLTLRQARLLANADCVTHAADVPAAILNRARADADRIACDTPPAGLSGLVVDVRMA